MSFLRNIPKDKLQKIVLVAVISLIAMVVVGHFYLGRQITTWTVSKRQIAQLNQQVADADRANKQEVDSKQMRETATAFVGTQEGTMITGDPFTWVVRQISLLAEQHPVHVISMNPGGKVQDDVRPRYSLYTTRIDVEGTYDQLGAFIEDFENKFPTGRIHSLGLVPSGVNAIAVGFVPTANAVPGPDARVIGVTVPAPKLAT